MVDDINEYRPRYTYISKIRLTMAVWMVGEGGQALYL